MSNPADAYHILKEGLANNIGRVGLYLAFDNGTQVRKTDVTDPYFISRSKEHILRRKPNESTPY